jgi:ankyrin repeat protein
VSKAFFVLFSRGEFIQEHRFIHLHRLIIGLETGFIEEELVDYPQSVHALDIDGWTPLHWAACRGNYQAIFNDLDDYEYISLKMSAGHNCAATTNE